LPNNIKRLVSPFFGGGSLEIAVAKELEIPVIGFDIFDILVNYWKFQINYPHLLYKELKKLKPDKKTYQWIKEKLKKHWKGEEKLQPLQLAVYYYFNHNLSYGPGFLGWMSSVYAREDVYQKMIERVRDFNVKNIIVRMRIFRKNNYKI
jgi:DNA adenine methylase